MEPQSSAASAVEEGEVVNVTVVMISGKSATLSLLSSSTVSQLRRAAATALELVNSTSLLRLVHGERILSDSATLKMNLTDVGVEDGTLLHAALSGGSLMELPEKFSLNVLVRGRYSSSSYTGMYVIHVDVPASKAAIELWRKNDHDVVTYDTLAGTMAIEAGHWMTGGQHHQERLDVSVPLSELLPKWISSFQEVVEDNDRFWRLPDSEIPPEQPAEEPSRAPEGDWRSTRPHRGCAPCPDSWIAADDRCSEYMVGADIPTGRSTSGVLLLLRLLVDPCGVPIRAAIATNRGASDV